jgi:hypothetical protein
MSRRSFARDVALAFVCAALAGCGGGAAPSPGAYGAVPQVNLGRSWVRPDLLKQWLLYVSDGASGAVEIYNYRAKHGRLVGELTGFRFPYGQCVDGSGDVYVVDNDTSKIYEYRHGVSTPAATASDRYGKPDGCSVDSSTGNVAVSNFSGATSSSAGGVDVFAGGLSGKQTYYTDPNLYRAFPGAYDPKGNFFAQGLSDSGVTNFAELPRRKKKFSKIGGLGVTFPGSVQWDGYYLAVTDQNYQSGFTTMIYRVTVSGSTATVVRSTHLIDNCYPGHDYMVAIQPFVTGVTRKLNTVVAGNLNCPGNYNYYDYAKGGLPVRKMRAAIAPFAPYGQTVSPPSSEK